MEPIEPYNQLVGFEEFVTFLTYFLSNNGKHLGAYDGTIVFSKGCYIGHALVVKIIGDSEEMWIFERDLVGDSFDFSVLDKSLKPYELVQVDHTSFRIRVNNFQGNVRQREPLSEVRIRANRLAVYKERLAVYGYTFESLAGYLMRELEAALQRLEKFVWKVGIHLNVKDCRIDIGDLVYFEHTKTRAHVEFPSAVKEVLRAAPDMLLGGTWRLGVFECALEPILYDKIEQRHKTMFFPIVTREFSRSSPYYLDWSKPGESGLHEKLHRVCQLAEDSYRTIRYKHVDNIRKAMLAVFPLEEIREELEKSILTTLEELKLFRVDRIIALSVWDNHFTIDVESPKGRMHRFLDLIPSRKARIEEVIPYSLEGGMARDDFNKNIIRPMVMELLRGELLCVLTFEDSYQTKIQLTLPARVYSEIPIGESLFAHWRPSDSILEEVKKIPHRIVETFPSLYTFTDHKLRECLYKTTPGDEHCDYVSHQHPEFEPAGVDCGHAAVVITLRNLPENSTFHSKGAWLPYSQSLSSSLHFYRDQTVFSSICYNHAQSNLTGALALLLEKYKGKLTANNLVVHHQKAMLKSFLQLHEEKQAKKEEEKTQLKILEKRAEEDSRKRERETARKAPVVEIGNSAAVAPGDRRCIHTIDNKSSWACQNVEYTFGATAGQDGAKEMPLPAYIVKKKGNLSQTLGNICYKHAITLQLSLRMIADYASVTMDDLHVEVHFDSGGCLPQKYDEEEWQLGHEIQPDWKPGDRLSTKWKMRNGEVCYCRFCKKQYFWPRFEYFKKLREQGADPNEVIEFHLSACKPCQDEKVAKGCKSCKAKITPANIPEGFSLEYDDFYTCSKPECWKCTSCRKPFSKFSVYQEQETALGLENVYSQKDWDKNEKGREQCKILYDAYFNASRFPDRRFVCRKCCGNREAKWVYY